jgi:serine protease Do
MTAPRQPSPLLFIVPFILCTSVLASAQDRFADHTRRRTPVVEVFEHSRDAVVNISSTEVINVRSPFGGSMFEELFNMPSRPRQYTRTSVGSGFLIHPDGYLVTNAHVVAGTAERKAIFADGSEYQAEIVAIDTERDIAVLKIDADHAFPTLPIGRSHDLMIGETVIAIGNPLGFQHTVTAGVVSATERDLEFSNQMKLAGLIQTDASINPGNSGGPLLNVLGELIGINTAIRGDAQNLSFAIPVDQLRDVLPDLLDVERRYRIVTGFEVATKDAPWVTSVEAASPAAAAGLQPGDVLEAVDGQLVAEGFDYHIALIGRRGGERVPLRVRRQGRLQELMLRLGERPAPDGVRLAAAKLGIEVHMLPREYAEELDLPGAQGLFIVSTERGGPADQRGIKPRDILLRIGKRDVVTPEKLGDILERLEGGEEVQISVLRVERRGKYILSGDIRIR